MIVIDSLDASKQSLIHRDIIAVLTEYWRNLLSQFVEKVCCLCTEQVEQHFSHLAKQFACSFESFYRILECWCFGIACDFSYLLVFLLNAFHDSWFVISFCYLVERYIIICIIKWIHIFIKIGVILLLILLVAIVLVCE